MAARVWLTDAIQMAMAAGDDVAPAIDLLGALEGLEFGHVDEMLRLPDGQKVGGKEPPPGQTGIDAMALAAVDRLCELDVRVKQACALVADELGISTGSLSSLRKHVNSERGKRKEFRTRYVSLIEDYESERKRMAGQTREEVSDGLACVAALLGRK
nr:hypothetical protein [Rhizobium rhizogenes]